ncbi:DUF5959 family protein [Kitasatospora purpeofusca]|uniref:DUF5959 family protein n=1 Tax=Kitasatospora purpeofusca TaxID=67352 RepID=UPI0035DA5426
MVSLRVLEQVPRSGFLECEFLVATRTVNGSFPLGITSDDLNDWEDALEKLADSRFVSWLGPAGRSSSGSSHFGTMRSECRSMTLPRPRWRSAC